MLFFTYIVASRKNGSVYTGSTDDLYVRVLQHRNGTFDGHTKRYGISRLVWFETHPTRDAAFIRERRIKEWKRNWRLELIERGNPGWRHLFEDLKRDRGSSPDDWTPPPEPDDG
nr:GIY-YIG nuclease family protein [Brevundimonas sp. AAP58]